MEGGPAAPGPSAGRGSRAPGSGVVAERFFSPQHLWQSLVGSEGLPSVLGAFLLNVQIFMVSEVFILILALVIAVVRGIPGPVFFPFRLVAVAYTDLFRGVPLILVLYMIGFGVPGLVLGSIEAARAAQIYGASEFNYASYVVAALLFVLITIPLARFTDRLIARDKRRREAGALA